MKRFCSFAVVAVLACSSAFGQVTDAPDDAVKGIPVNYTESKVGTYTLPDPLKCEDGTAVKDTDAWMTKRRPEIVKLYEENQYGRAPGRPADMRFDVFDTGTPAFGGKAMRRQVTVYFSADKNGPQVWICLIYVAGGGDEAGAVAVEREFRGEQYGGAG